VHDLVYNVNTVLEQRSYGILQIRKMMPRFLLDIALTSYEFNFWTM